MKKVLFLAVIFTTLSFSFFFGTKIAFAAAPDFIVGPAKNEITIKAGETQKISFALINRLGKDTTFSLSTGALITDKDGNLVPSSETMNEVVSLPGKVFVKNGATKIVEGTVALKKNVDLETKAFGIFVEPTKNGGDEIVSHSRAQIINIINNSSSGIQSGALKTFEISDHRIFRMDDIAPLSVSFSNLGTKYLNPYGIVVVKNIFGREVSAQKIDPWYVMPNSTRTREITISTDKFFGRYTATLSLNRGYGDLVDTKTISFYVIPFWFPIILVVLLTVIFFWFSKKGFFRGALVVALLLVGVVNAHAQMSSGNYKVQFDSVNFGGGLSSSTSYKQESTFGEVATGEIASANYNVHAGYQQMNEVFLSISTPADVTLSPNLGDISGGTSDGSTVVTVATDGAAGYSLYVNASTSPALASGTDSFTDYVPGGAVPDFSFTFLNNQSFFGFSPEGADITSNFKDNGVTCGAGALDAVGACWDGFATSIKQVALRTSANTPSGTNTTLKLRAGAGASRNQQAGNYSGDITFTATAL